MSKKNYAGIPDKHARIDEAKVVLIPVPYDGTSTWQKGADKGPEAFLNASENMELYDIETRSEVYRQGIYLAPPVTEDSSPEKMVEAVYKTTKNYIKQDKFVTLFGGEHSISIGSIKAFNESFEDLTVVQLDAHADLRPEYEGSSCNHACAMHEASKTTNLVQVGIRSMDVSENDHMDENQVYFAHDLYEDWQEDAIGQMTPNVFITIDLDALDPSIMPSTGTPEPGGLFWYETLEFLKMMFKKKNVVGFDIVELCPNKEEKSSDFLAAKLYYKMLSYKFKYQDYNEQDEDE
ncbi:agmatinase [Christiangramia forsetii]|uniref:Agmatinase n=2 Tax=Christiangramia forsetii TaxID=411153 RepID=A0M7G7_CHRFK|nr:agmatinase [Christiangramia forsetii]GGG27953.1 agmatinase [Christiangramia forsetii]CAL68562.1 agmatinase [Christiangramia forsetii KT0803]